MSNLLQRLGRDKPNLTHEEKKAICETAAKIQESGDSDSDKDKNNSDEDKK